MPAFLTPVQLDALRRMQIGYQPEVTPADAPAAPAPAAASAPPMAVAYQPQIQQGPPQQAQIVPPEAAPPPSAYTQPRVLPPEQQAPKQIVTRQAAPQGQAGAPEVQGEGSPDDAAIARLMHPGVSGPPATRPTGLSKADTAYEGALSAQAQGLTDAINSGIAMHQQNAQAFADQSKALAADSAEGLARYQTEIAKNATKRAAIAQQVDEDDRRIRGELANVQAAGVDPGRYFHSMSNYNRMMTGLGLVLSRMGSTLTKGPDTAFEMVQNAIKDDVEAQKANIAKAVDLAKYKGALNEQKAAHLMAMNDAERQSIQTGYAVAEDALQKKVSLFKDNASVQSNATEAIARLREMKLKDMQPLLEQRYQIEKAAEKPKPVAGASGGIDRKWVAEQTLKIQQESAANGQPMSTEQARAIALNAGYGLRARGYEYNLPAKPAKGGAGQTGKDMLALDQAISLVNQIQTLRQKHNGGTLAPEDRATGQALAARAQERLVAALGRTNQGLLDRTSHMIPDNPMELQAAGLLGSDPNGARLAAASKMLQEERARLQQIGQVSTDTGKDEEPERPEY